MTSLDFLRLFRAILSPHAKVSPEAVERMGLLAVKIAQMYAVRPDLVGPDKCRALSRLLHRAEPLDEAAFQSRWTELAPPRLLDELVFLERRPLAVASLGQVHRATLRDGRRVVVKIARRDVREAFLHDVARFRRLLHFALFVYPRLQRLADPAGALDAVVRQTLTEMDFLAEERGADRLAALAAEGAPRLPHLARLHFPEVLTGLSHDRFLVSEYVEGLTLAEWIERGGLPYEVLLELFRVHGYFLFVRGEFHGDLHPGNVIWHGGRFWFLDNANIETVPPAFARGLFEMLFRLGQGDETGAARALLGLSLTPLTLARSRHFESEFCALYRDFAGRTVSEISLTSQMMKTVRLAVESGLTFPRGAFPLIKSLMYLDGMVLRCAPDAVLLRDVARFAEDFTGQTEGFFPEKIARPFDSAPSPHSSFQRSTPPARA